MRNFVEPGNTITVIAPAAVTSGQVVIVGSIAGVATNNADVGKELELSVEGVFDLGKVPADALAAGAIAKADPATGIVGTAGTKNIGWVLSAAGAGATTVRVKLTPGIG